MKLTLSRKTVEYVRSLGSRRAIGKNMINRVELAALVERVTIRLAEAVPAPATAKTGNFRYNNDGTAVSERPPSVSDTAKTQMPPTQHPPTIAAAASSAEQSARADGIGTGSTITANPNRVPSQKSIKVNSIKKALDAQGYTADANNAKRVTQNLGAWYDQLDPSDALVATADELALRFAGEG